MEVYRDMSGNHRLLTILASLILLLITIGLAARSASAQKPVVHMLLFHSPTCPHCKEVIEEILPPIQEKYKDAIEIRMLDVSDPANRWLQLELEKQIGVPENVCGAVPTILIGPSLDGSVKGSLLIGSKDISQELEPLIQKYLDAGGAPLPIPLDDILEKLHRSLTTTPTPAQKATPPEPSATSTPAGELKPIYIAYFAAPGCQECARAKYDLNLLASRYPQVKVVTFEIGRYSELNEWLGERMDVPEEKRLIVPAVFVGHSFLLGDEVSYANLCALVERYHATGALPLWEEWEKERDQARRSIIQRFRSFNLPTVMAAGLLDGVNPCAFATIVFFISYLSLIGRKGREVLAVGSAFTLSVFLAYMGIGLGLLSVLHALGTVLARWLNLLVALLCFGLAFFGFLDFLKARRGAHDEMILSLPMRLRRQINRVIREGVRTEAYVSAAFLTGLSVSLIEFLCTGQVYVPILTALNQPSLRARALFYLIIYCLAFVIPLVVVFLMTYFGTESKVMARFINRHMAKVKLAMTGLFLLLGVWLITMVW